MWDQIINVNALAAAGLFASTDKARGHIQQIKVARVGEGDGAFNMYLATNSYFGALVAEGQQPTNGSLDGAVEFLLGHMSSIKDDDREGQWTVPAQAAKEAHTKMRKDIGVALVMDNENYTFVGNSQRLMGPRVQSEMRWSSFLKLFPSAENVKQSPGITNGVTMDFKMLGIMGKVADLLGAVNSMVSIIGNGATDNKVGKPQAFMTWGDYGTAYMIQMPVRRS